MPPFSSICSIASAHYLTDDLFQRRITRLFSIPTNFGFSPSLIVIVSSIVSMFFEYPEKNSAFLFLMSI